MPHPGEEQPRQGFLRAPSPTYVNVRSTPLYLPLTFERGQGAWTGVLFLDLEADTLIKLQVSLGMGSPRRDVSANPSAREFEHDAGRSTHRHV